MNDIPMEWRLDTDGYFVTQNLMKLTELVVEKTFLLHDVTYFPLLTIIVGHAVSVAAQW